MWLIAICIVFWLMAYGGAMPYPINEFVRLLSGLGFVASVICYIVAWVKDEKIRKTEEPNIMTFHGSYPEYKQALAEWKKTQEIPIENLPFGERLRKRNVKHDIRHGYDRDEKCLICGDIKAYGQPYCTECLNLYKGSPKESLPDGIPEKYRMLLWAVRQSVIIDCQEGKIDEATAKREIAIDAVEHVKQIISMRQKLKEEHENHNLQHAQYLQERLSLTERLSPK